MVLALNELDTPEADARLLQMIGIVGPGRAPSGKLMADGGGPAGRSARR